MEYNEQILKNGMRVLFVNTPSSSSGTVQIWFRAGSALEDKSNQGIAHFLEHMFFKGTKKRPGALLASEIESYGGEVNAFTSFDYTCYYINFPANKIEKSIDILLDMVTDPMFKHEDIVPERGVVYEEYLRGMDNPLQFGFGQLQSQCFPKGYNHMIIGTEKTIKNFSKEQLIEFRKNNYNSSNAMLVVAGDLTHKEKVTNLIEKYKLPSGPKSKFPKFNLKKQPTLGGHKKDVNLTQITISINGDSFDNKLTPAKDLAMHAISLGQTSRLHKGLVLDGAKANSVSASSMYMNRGGMHLIKVTFPHENLSTVLTTLQKIINTTLKEGLTSNEVNKIKNQYLASKVYEKESVEQFAFTLGSSFAQNGDIESESKLIEKVKTLSTSAVNSALLKIFSNELHINIQVPRGKSTEKAKKTVSQFQTSFKKTINSLLSEKKSIKDSTTSKFDKNVELVKIKNGLSLLYRYNPLTPTFVMQANIKGGLSHETKKNNGIYSLIASELTKGYGKIKHEELSEFLENSSTSLSGFSGKNAYGLTMHGQTKDIRELVGHFFGSLLTPSIPQNLLINDKEITLRGIESAKKDPVRQCFNSFTTTIFGKHPYSMPTVGTTESIKSIKRSDIVELHSSNIRKKDILLTYCGDLELDDILELIKPHLSDIPAKKIKNKKLPKAKSFNKEVRTDLELDREQTHLFTGVMTPALSDTSNICLKMLTAYLSGQSSELFTLLRDELGLCYTVQPVFFNALESGYWGIYMATGADQTEIAIASIKQLLNSYKVKGISKKEFNRLKKMMAGQNAVNIQTNDDYASIYSIPELHGFGMDFHHKTEDKIMNLSHEDFQKGVSKFLSKKWTTVTVGRKLTPQNSQVK